MPTEKPRFSITIEQKILDEVDAFKEEHAYTSQSKAIVALIERGINELQKNAPPQEGEALPEGYADLTPEHRELVDSLIRSLAAKGKEK